MYVGYVAAVSGWRIVSARWGDSLAGS